MSETVTAAVSEDTGTSEAGPLGHGTPEGEATP
jgi:hypothetical protein